MTKKKPKFKRVSQEAREAQPATAPAHAKPARKKFARAGSSKIDHPHRDLYPNLTDEEFVEMIERQQQMREAKREGKANGTANGAGKPILAGIPTPPPKPEQPVVEMAKTVEEAKAQAEVAEPTVAEPEVVVEQVEVKSESQDKDKAKPETKKPATKMKKKKASTLTKSQAKKTTTKTKRLVLKPNVKARILEFLEGNSQEDLVKALDSFEDKGSSISDEQYADCIDFLLNQG